MTAKHREKDVIDRFFDNDWVVGTLAVGGLVLFIAAAVGAFMWLNHAPEYSPDAPGILSASKLSKSVSREYNKNPIAWGARGDVVETYGKIRNISVNGEVTLREYPGGIDDVVVCHFDLETAKTLIDGKFTAVKGTIDDVELIVEHDLFKKEYHALHMIDCKLLEFTGTYPY